MARNPRRLRRRRRTIHFRQIVSKTHVGGDLLQVVNVAEEVTELDAATAHLAATMRTLLDEEVGRQEIHRPLPIAVRWSPSGRPIQGAAAAAETMRLSGGDVTEVAELIRQRVLPQRQLVVLGAPGAGKSILALLLAHNLVRQREPTDPVPVLLPLSSWRPEIDLHTWMAKRILAFCPDLATDYDPDITRSLVKHQRVMPVLDGLDELPGPLHASAIEAIDKTVADGVPLLVTCRSVEYQHAVITSGQYFTRAAVVELEPIAAPEAIRFLQASATVEDTRWDAVAKHLQREPDSSLSVVLSSPLMLFLARTAYRPGTTDPVELLDPARFKSRNNVEDHLLDVYLPTVYAVSAGSRYKHKKVKSWFEFMARRMHNHDTVDFTWRQVHSPITVPLFAMVCSLLCGWFSYLFFGPGDALLGIVSAGLLCGVAAHWVRRSGMGERDEAHDDPATTLGRHAIVSVLGCSLGACLAAASVTYWLRVTVGVTSQIAWTYGIAAGLGLGCAILLGSNWGSYTVSLLWYRLTNRLPWRLRRFLEEAHRLGVLRLTGSRYQFRHLRLLERLSKHTWSYESNETTEPTNIPSSRQWRKAARPMAAYLTLLGVAFATIVAFIAAAVQTSSNPSLGYLSGDKPTRTNSPMCLIGDGTDPSTTCVENDVSLTWRLSASSRANTVLAPISREITPVPQGFVGTPSDRPIRTLGGDLRMAGCTHASIQIEAIVAGIPLEPIVLKSTASPTSAWSEVPKGPQSIPTVEIKLRRLDNLPCVLDFIWNEPGINFDPYAQVRRRLT